MRKFLPTLLTWVGVAVLCVAINWFVQNLFDITNPQDNVQVFATALIVCAVVWGVNREREKKRKH